MDLLKMEEPLAARNAVIEELKPNGFLNKPAVQI